VYFFVNCNLVAVLINIQKILFMKNPVSCLRHAIFNLPEKKVKLPFRFSKIYLLLAATCYVQTAFANNLQIGNVSIASQNTVSNFSLVKFDISWENSWRTSVGPANWDAAWVFVKFRIKTQKTWKHATLNWVNGSGNGDGHVVPPSATIASSNDNGAGGSHGVFIYHNTDMLQSAVNYPGVELVWNYGTDGVNDGDSVEICVLGIEMVRVPQGSFYVGDGNDGTVSAIEGQFHDASGITNPFQISSEAAITLGGLTPGSLNNNNGNGMQLGTDDFNNTVSQTLPASFPKGHKAFYCMKYEITQEQYVIFLNKLSYSQQMERTDGKFLAPLSTPPNSPAGTNVLTFFGTPFRNRIVIVTPGTSPGTPAVYGCNLNNNGTFDEADDGQSIACTQLQWADLTAYLDWTALRPMTELEFEKACRGDQLPVAGETAWGATFDWKLMPGVNNSGKADESSTDISANINVMSWVFADGPARVGMFGQGINTRYATGATYYGIMEMSGNVWERTVTTGNPAGRSFTGLHGDGTLSTVQVLGVREIGDADVLNWPGYDAMGSGFRGSAWYFDSPDAVTVSDRLYASSNQPFRLYNYGGRGVRTAPF
jgi:formylglycine-generating enzyme required for sulfatase activity